MQRLNHTFINNLSRAHLGGHIFYTQVLGRLSSPPSLSTHLHNFVSKVGDEATAADLDDNLSFLALIILYGRVADFAAVSLLFVLHYGGLRKVIHVATQRRLKEHIF